MRNIEWKIFSKKKKITLPIIQCASVWRPINHIRQLNLTAICHFSWNEKCWDSKQNCRFPFGIGGIRKLTSTSKNAYMQIGLNVCLHVLHRLCGPTIKRNSISFGHTHQAAYSRCASGRKQRRDISSQHIKNALANMQILCVFVCGFFFCSSTCSFFWPFSFSYE